MNLEFNSDRVISRKCFIRINSEYRKLTQSIRLTF